MIVSGRQPLFSLFQNSLWPHCLPHGLFSVWNERCPSPSVCSTTSCARPVKERNTMWKSLETKKRRKHRSDGGACAHLQGFVLPIGETSEGCEEVDVCALDKLLLCLAELLLSLSAPEQGHPCRHSMLLAQHTHSSIHLYISLLVIVNDLA